LIKDVPADRLDIELESIANDQDRMFALSQLSNLAPTPKRVSMLKRDLPDVIMWPPLGDGLAKLIVAYWSPEVLTRVTEVVAELPLTESSLVVMRRVENAVGARLSRDEADQIVAPVLATCNRSAGKSVLKLWIDLAASRRQRAAR